MTDKDKKTISLIDMLKLQSICKKLYTLALQYEQSEAALLGGGIDYSKDRIQTTPTNQLEKIECELYDLEKKINELIKEKQYYIDKLKRIKNKAEYYVLIDKYVKGKSLNKIAREKNKTKSSIYRTLQRALVSYYKAQYIVDK